MRKLFAVLVLSLFSFVALSVEIITQEDIEIDGIKATVYKKGATIFDELFEDEDKYFLEVKFQELSDVQFEALKKKYGNSTHQTYDVNKKNDYRLIDFLPESAQALNGKVFLTKSYDLDMGQMEDLKFSEGLKFMLYRGGLGSMSNCWNTTIEVLRHEYKPEGGFKLYWPGRWAMNDLFRPQVETGVFVEGDGESFGNIMVVSENQEFSQIVMTMHTALILDDRFVFEKTDSTDNDAYRIAYKKDVIKKYQEYFGETLVIDYKKIADHEAFYTATEPNPLDFNDGYMEPEDKDRLAGAFPTLDIDAIAVGCETGTGGGCTPTATEIEVLQFNTLGNEIEVQAGEASDALSRLLEVEKAEEKARQESSQTL